jgi:orotate phosphoribosyltransferase
MTNLFQFGFFKLNSGRETSFKIECDALTKDDWNTLAFLISSKVTFREVIGVPKGGLPLAESLKKFIQKDEKLPRLIVDDVLTTGNSIRKLMQKGDKAFVVFARQTCPDDIQCLFQLKGFDYER